MNERYQILDEFSLKIFAFLTMALDHVGLFLMMNYASATNAYTVGSVFRIIGRLAFPLFAFFLAEGMRHTKDRKRYVLRLFYIWIGIAIIQAILYSIYRYSLQIGTVSVWSDLGGAMGAQAFTDLLLFALFIYLIEHPNNKIRPLSCLPVLGIVASYVLGVLDRYGINTYLYFPEFLRAGYNIFGFIIFLGFYYTYNLTDLWVKKGLQMDDKQLVSYKTNPTYRRLVNMIGVTIFLITVLLLWGASYLNWHLDVYENPDTKIQNYCLLDAVLFLMYSGKRGYDKKWWRTFEYLFYPLHIAVIALIFTLILN